MAAKCKICGKNETSGGSDICDSCGAEIMKKAGKSPEVRRKLDWLRRRTGNGHKPGGKK